MTLSRRSLFGGILALIGWRAPQVAPKRPWQGYASRWLGETSAWDDYHDWRAWMQSKFADDPIVFEGSDTSPVRLYCVMCELADGTPDRRVG